MKNKKCINNLFLSFILGTSICSFLINDNNNNVDKIETEIKLSKNLPENKTLYLNIDNEDFIDNEKTTKTLHYANGEEVKLNSYDNVETNIEFNIYKEYTNNFNKDTFKNLIIDSISFPGWGLYSSSSDFSFHKSEVQDASIFNDVNESFINSLPDEDKISFDHSYGSKYYLTPISLSSNIIGDYYDINLLNNGYFLAIDIDDELNLPSDQHINISIDKNKMNIEYEKSINEIFSNINKTNEGSNSVFNYNENIFSKLDDEILVSEVQEKYSVNNDSFEESISIWNNSYAKKYQPIFSGVTLITDEKIDEKYFENSGEYFRTIFEDEYKFKKNNINFNLYWTKNKIKPNGKYETFFNISFGIGNTNEEMDNFKKDNISRLNRVKSEYDLDSNLIYYYEPYSESIWIVNPNHNIKLDKYISKLKIVTYIYTSSFLVLGIGLTLFWLYRRSK